MPRLFITVIHGLKKKKDIQCRDKEPGSLETSYCRVVGMTAHRVYSTVLYWIRMAEVGVGRVGLIAVSSRVP
jgi:hypothetical protein